MSLYICVLWVESIPQPITYDTTKNESTMATVELKLTGVLIGNDKEGYTTFFKEFPFVCAEGYTMKDAQQNLYESLLYMFEYIQENFYEGQDESAKHEQEGTALRSTYTSNLVLA